MDDTSVPDDCTEDSEENKLEITRNPFDSQLCDKENFPGLDSSIFLQSASPYQESDVGFRWSIDQMSLLNPADLDLYPNQEYSISYQKKEDEIRDQEEVNKYFQNVLLPSPWFDEKNEGLKRVTFSPHPPSLRYIPGVNQNLDSTHSSISPSNNISMEGEKATMLSDACCQTKITIPPYFDLEALLMKHFSTYEEVGDGKELMTSTLRRKLFVQDVSSPGVNTSQFMRANCIMSSSRKAGTSSSPPYSSSKSNLDSPSLMISPPHHKSSNVSSISVFSSSIESSPRHGSNIDTPCFLRNMEMSLSPLTVSPIKSCEKNCYSFMPDVSFDDETGNGSDCIKESSPVAALVSPNVSPIASEIKRFGSSEFGESSNFNVKESTAFYPHAFSGFDMSSIDVNASKGVSVEASLGNNDKKTESFESREFGVNLIVEDDGPLDITELTANKKDSDNNECNLTQNSNSDNQLNIADITHINGLIGVQRGINSIYESKSDGSQCSKSVTNTEAKQYFPNSPLRGILKKRETLTPKKPILENITQFNTICNSGKKRPVPTLSLSSDIDTKHDSSKPPFINRPLNEELRGVLENDSIDPFISHANLVRIKATSVLRRASYAANGLDNEVIEKDFITRNENELDTEMYGKENIAGINGHQRNADIGLAFVHVSKNNFVLQSEKEVQSNFDSGICSMEWSAEKQMERSKITKRSSLSITPVIGLENLKLDATSRWSVKKNTFSHHGKFNITRKSSLIRSHSWRDRSRSSSPVTPKSFPQHSHVLLRSYRNDISAMKRRQSDQSSHSVFSAYKNMLPSPLR